MCGFAICRHAGVLIKSSRVTGVGLRYKDMNNKTQADH